MRYRTLDANGDYVLGKGPSSILTNTPAAVAQSVMTRLLLKTGEWFLDVTEGTPYIPDVLGAGTKSTYDAAIRDRILTTNGVTEILDYSSTLDPVTRKLSISCEINTLYGNTILDTVI